MKVKLQIVLSTVMFLMLCPFAFVRAAEMQPSVPVSGEVLDANDLPLPGVTVRVQGTTIGTATDVDGKFTLTVPDENSVLLFSFVGYGQLAVTVGRQRIFRLTMQEVSSELEEVVVVAYGAQKKISVTAAISTVQTRELKQSSAANLSSALAGRLPGLTALQTSGQPGNDMVNLYLRGVGTINDASPLILIDGVPRTNISVLDPNEIAAVSILKDASATAVFGVRGANGVILITTRRGTPGRTELSLSVDQSFQKFITRADRLHSWEFAELRNRSYLNDHPGALDADLPYTPYMIDMYKSGADPAFYPDRDVFHDYFRDWTPQTRVNLNLTGGTEKISYFLNVGYVGQDGQFKTEPESVLGYDPGYRMDRYTFRSNVDYKIADHLKLSLNIGTYLEKMNSPQTSQLFNDDMTTMVQNMIAYTWATPPTDPGPMTVDGYGVPAGEILNQSGADRNTYGETNRRGYRQETNTMLNSSLALDWELDFITKGLSAKAMIAFDAKARTVLQGYRAYDTYQWHVARSADEESWYSLTNGNQDVSIHLSKGMNTYYYMNFQGSLNYARSFGRHDVGAMALFQRDNYERADYGADLPYNVIGLVARATYGYDERYLAEFNAGYNGTEQFAPDNRFGFFPAVSVGWVVSNEKFLKDNPVLTRLKLRASYGIVGNDKLGDLRFLYQSNIMRAGGVISSLGRSNRISQGLMANEHIQWEESRKQNYGLDVQVFKSLTLTADIFWEKRDKILLTRQTVPVLQGVPLDNIPKVNMGKMDNRGYEIELTYQKTVNTDLSFTVKGNYVYNENRQIMVDEPMRSDDYAYRYRNTGFSTGQIFGYQVDYSNGNGYINTQEELDKAIRTYEVGGTPRLGDLKYVDANVDGVINVKDHVPLGYSEVPRIAYGFSGSLNYMNLDFSFLFSGVAKNSRLYMGDGKIGWGVVESVLAGFYTDWHLRAWTQERYDNGEEIRYPALGTGNGSSQHDNSFYMFDRSFLRLKNAELGYSIPQKWLQPLHISRVRVYVNGNNLLTWKKYPVNTVDPEADALTYPITKMVNAGFNVVF
ncbi:MAG: TonB-dependent receptor [Bacteroidales bacterium]|jgi:TonB-linked SusC/RagA family outer membrane protein|nr:TonB-dependent receptor [Bacteroidales bacterium]